MSKVQITGGRRLEGSVRVHGAKNSVLPIMAAAIISGGETVIKNAPRLSDVDAAMRILRHLGCRAELNNGIIHIDSRDMNRYDIPDSLMREMRSSVFFLGAILARAGEAVLSIPGGCELGPRPINLHVAALRAMGAEIDERGGNLICRAPAMRGCRVDLSFPSVGATENSMIAAAGCVGKTVIANAAREPEIRDLGDYLNKLGVTVTGAGTSIVTVEGRARRDTVEHHVIPDRIVASTILASCASAGGKVCITDVLPKDLAGVMEVLSQMGCRVEADKNSICLTAPDRLRAPKPVITKPYPGFPTDAQPPILAASLRAEGTTVFVETIFENRYRHVPELRRMGADIRTDGRVAMISGVRDLHAATVEAHDLRGAAALTVAALAAEGKTEISGVHHMDRGYDGLVETLAHLGANAVRIGGKG